MTIATYSDLVTEVRDMADDDNYSSSAIDSAIAKAEAHFNRVIRVPDMETATTIAVTTEFADLPTDFLEMRAIQPAGSPCYTLKSTTPAALYMDYRGLSGTPTAYAIEGKRLRFGPVGTGSFDMLYYAKIPALSASNTTNWLLTKHPDCYLAGVMYHLARRERDSDGQAQAVNELSEIIDAINVAGQAARWGAGPLVPQGMRQVRGPRV